MRTIDAIEILPADLDFLFSVSDLKDVNRLDRLLKSLQKFEAKKIKVQLQDVEESARRLGGNVLVYSDSKESVVGRLFFDEQEATKVIQTQLKIIEHHEQELQKLKQKLTDFIESANK